jgi:predicted nucleic acid-binding protein
LKGLVFDTSALLRYFFGEPGAEDIRALFAEKNDGTRYVLCSVNLSELYVVLGRSVGGDSIEEAWSRIQELGFELVAPDEAVARKAADFKLRYRMAQGDAFAAACAQVEGLPIITSDQGFRPLSKEIKIRWVADV